MKTKEQTVEEGRNIKGKRGKGRESEEKGKKKKRVREPGT